MNAEILDGVVATFREGHNVIEVFGDRDEIVRAAAGHDGELGRHDLFLIRTIVRVTLVSKARVWALGSEAQQADPA